MFHLRPVPFSCPYRTDFLCPVSVTLAERDPDKQGLVEAMPCNVCPHYVESAQTLFGQRRVQLGLLERQVLDVTRTSGTVFVPLSSTLRTQFPQRIDLRRLRKAVHAVVAVRALRAFRLPAVVPRAYNSRHVVLRDTLWVQLTAVGEMLSEHTFGQHGASWRKQQRQMSARLSSLRTELAQTDLLAVYVRQTVAVVTLVTQHVVAATDKVMVALCTSADSPYVGVFVHLEAIAPTACAELQQSYLRVQDARRRAVAIYRAAERQHAQGHNSTPEVESRFSGGEL
jgi:hypothetical protein